MQHVIKCKEDAKDLFLVKDDRDGSFVMFIRTDNHGVGLTFCYDPTDAIIFDYELLDAFFCFIGRTGNNNLSVFPVADLFDDASDSEVPGLD